MLPLVVAGAQAAFELAASSQKGEILRMQQGLQNQINDLNAGFAEQDAFNAEKEGNADAARYQNVIDSTVGDQRVGYASQNVDVGYGTAAELQSDSKLTGMMNLMELKRRGYQKSNQFKAEARNIRLTGANRSAQTSLDASAATSQGMVSAGKTLLSGYARST